jgi:hypothetical protein
VRGLGKTVIGHEFRIKHKSRTSALPPILDIFAATHRLASYQSDPRRGKAGRGERREGAGAACCSENSERHLCCTTSLEPLCSASFCSRGRDETEGYPRVHALSVGEK